MSVDQTLNRLSSFLEDLVREVYTRNIERLRDANVRDLIDSAEFRQLIINELQNNPKFRGPVGNQGTQGPQGPQGFQGLKPPTSEIRELIEEELDKNPKYQGPKGNVGPRGPAGSIDAALNNCSVLLDQRLQAFREEIAAMLAKALRDNA